MTGAYWGWRRVKDAGTGKRRATRQQQRLQFAGLQFNIETLKGSKHGNNLIIFIL